MPAETLKRGLVGFDVRCRDCLLECSPWDSRNLRGGIGRTVASPPHGGPGPMSALIDAPAHARPAVGARARAVAALAASLLLAGCNLGPIYHRPALALPAAFRAPAPPAASVWPAPGWWQAFGSPELDALIDEAAAHNQNIAAAIAQVRAADAAVEVAGAPLLPSVTALGSGTYERIGTGVHRSGSSSTAFTTTPAGTVVGVSSGSSSHYTDVRSYQLSLDASYDIDFWGRNRALYQSAQASAIASRYAEQVVALTVVTGVATTYLTALGLQDEIRVEQQNLRDAQQVLAATQGQLEAGTASELDVAQQQALVDGLRATIPALISQEKQEVIGLGILVGRPPETITIASGTLTRLPVPGVAPGLPIGLLARRPDVAEAEAQIVAENGNVRAARAAFFPAVSLTSSAGWQSTALTALISPGSALFSIGASVAQTVFDNGLLQGQYRQVRATEDQLVAAYRQSVLQALTDVENALTALRYTTEQEAIQRQAVASAQRAATIARAQLEAGTVNIITVLNTETTLYGDVSTLAQVRLARFQALIALYKALGGGWHLAPQGA
jgi:NodT family efflux transporter outer membrane factor (OMF) lipoprotein